MSGAFLEWYVFISKFFVLLGLNSSLGKKCFGCKCNWEIGKGGIYKCMQLKVKQTGKQGYACALRARYQGLCLSTPKTINSMSRRKGENVFYREVGVPWISVSALLLRALLTVFTVHWFSPLFLHPHVNLEKGAWKRKPKFFFSCFTLLYDYNSWWIGHLKTNWHVIFKVVFSSSHHGYSCVVLCLNWVSGSMSFSCSMS